MPISLTTTESQRRVVIVGAGVIGLSLAWELVRRGLKVTLVDRGRVGQGTSWAAAGILPAARRDTALDPLDRLRGLSHELYPDWSARLYEVSAIDCGFRQCGGLYLASSAGEAASLVAWSQYQRDLGIDLHRLDASGLVKREPALSHWAESSAFRAAIESPREWQVRPPALLKALVAACKIQGVEVREQFDAGLVRRGDRIEINGLQLDDAVICSGVWSGKLAGELGLAMSLIPIRGQMMMFKFPSPPVQCVVNEGNRYLVPRDDGRLIVGSCEEEVGFELGTTDEMLRPLRKWAESILPAIRLLQPERTWSGLRPATFDGFPLIGNMPDVDNLYFATGHYRSGIHLAPATAAVLADLMLQQKPAVDLAPLAVGRMIQTDPVQ